MMQALHIFRKDVRYLWRELSVYAALLILFGWVAPKLWDTAASAETTTAFGVFSILLRVLIPTSWLFLIARLIHDECLLGDQQFWITRPYRWTSLLAAKLLFIATCIALPYFLMQMALLLTAGMHPAASLSGLLKTVAYLTLVALFPITAIASVTSTLISTFMTLIVALLLPWVVILVLMGAEGGMRSTAPYLLEAWAVAFTVIVLGTLLYQYATRDTQRARILLACTVVLFLGGYCAAREFNTSAPFSLLMRHGYPESTQLHLVFNSNASGYDPVPSRKPNKNPEDLVRMTLPVQIDGLSAAEKIFDPNVTFTVDAPGVHYTSPWRPVVIDSDGMALLIPKTVLDTVGAGNARVHLSLATERLVPGPAQVIPAAPRFGIPGGGDCVMEPAHSGNNITCRYGFENTVPTQVTGMIHTGACDQPGTTRSATATLHAMPAGTRVDPVIVEAVQLGGMVCPGTPLAFLPYHPGANVRIESDLPGLPLARYRERS